LIARTLTSGGAGSRQDKQPMVGIDLRNGTTGAVAHAIQAAGQGEGRGRCINAIPHVPDVAWCLQERDAKGPDSDTKDGRLIPVLGVAVFACDCGADSGIALSQECPACGRIQSGSVTHALTAEGHDASEDGTGRGTPLVASTFNPQSGGDCRGLNLETERARALHVGQAPALAFQCHGTNVGPMGTLRSGNGGLTGGVPFVGVRRLTPRECERLQGFPDDHTKPGDQKDSPRYRQLGNAVSVPVAEWTGRRIARVQAQSAAAQPGEVA
jgi:hypothetical protein